MLLDVLRGLTGDLFHVMSAAVVAILAMQTHRGREVLMNEVDCPEFRKYWRRRHRRVGLPR